MPLDLGIGGVARLDTLTVHASASQATSSETSPLEFELSLSGSPRLGPVAVTLERVGIAAKLDFPNDGGNLGFVNLDPKFKSPSGIGLVVDTDVVRGGGYLYLDPDRGIYYGALELKISDMIQVKAIAVITTRLPDGSSGFSMLIIITAQFDVGIQLGLGFTLNGIGGLIGINRAMDVEALQRGVHSGSLDSVLFPNDPLEHLPKLISDLNGFFPAQDGRYLIGLMVIIGWGAPTLIEVKLGIIIELPSFKIALLGQLSIALPTKEAPVVQIKAYVLGVFDPENQQISIDASLYDSHVAGFQLEGDMAFRLSWGNSPTFLLSIGGYHPGFQPPANAPTGLKRVTIALGSDNPRINVQGYLAITSNSLQFGASAEVYAAIGEFNLRAWLEFDALLIFKPLYFRFDFSVGVELRYGRHMLAGISLSGMLSGPKPFHIEGEASVSILMFDVTVSFSFNIGGKQPIKDRESQNVWLQLKAAIEDPQNWSTKLDPTVDSGVTLRSPQATDTFILVQPMGKATLHQKVVPLNRKLAKYGEFSISGPDDFTLSNVEIGGVSLPKYQTGTDFFAPGQFEELGTAEKLSRRSFESWDSGITIGSDEIDFGKKKPAVAVALSTKQVW